MSAGSVVRAAVLAALRGDAVIAAQANAVAEGEAARVTAPYVRLRDVAESDWGTKDAAGREVRVGVTVRDAGEGAGRAQEIADAAEAAVAGMPSDLGGWRVASLVLVRRVTLDEGRGDGAGRWAVMVDWRVRVLAG